MKVYTKTGDKGTTSLVGGTRVAKDDIRLEAYGTVDELNSWIGLLCAQPIADAETMRILTTVQNKLFDIGSALATEIDSKWQPRLISANDIAAIEADIDRMESVLPAHDRFILPGGTQAASIANVARTVARRAERRIVALPEGTAPGQQPTVQFVNRLSDFLFVLSRYLNFLAHQREIFWDKDCSF